MSGSLAQLNYNFPSVIPSVWTLDLWNFKDLCFGIRHADLYFYKCISARWHVQTYAYKLHKTVTSTA